MCDVSWQHKLTQLIRSQNNQVEPTAIIGIGHPLFGDDYIGCWVTHQLQTLGNISDTIQIITAESNPENFIGPIVRFSPRHVLLVDAIAGEDISKIIVLPWQEELVLDTYLFSLPLTNFCTFLQREISCQITLIGITIASPVMSTSITPPVLAAGQQIVDFLQKTYKKSD